MSKSFSLITLFASMHCLYSIAADEDTQHYQSFHVLLFSALYCPILRLYSIQSSLYSSHGIMRSFPLLQNTAHPSVPPWLHIYTVQMANKRSKIEYIINFHNNNNNNNVQTRWWIIISSIISIFTYSYSDVSLVRPKGGGKKMTLVDRWKWQRRMEGQSEGITWSYSGLADGHTLNNLFSFSQLNNIYHHLCHHFVLNKKKSFRLFIYE